MYIKNIYMAPPVAYERQACLGIYSTHVKYNTAIMQQSIKTRETQHKQNLCYTVTSVYMGWRVLGSESMI